MKRYVFACSLIALLAAATGCATCGSPFDYSYAAYGGKWQRGDSDEGRVGSALDPAEVTSAEEDTGIAFQGEPTPADASTQPPTEGVEATSQGAPAPGNDQPPTPPGI
jgi:hypothetical protein